MRAIVTRPADSGDAWRARLAARGVDAVCLPLIEIAPAADPLPLREAWRHLDECSGVMFVSTSAVRGFFAQRPARAPWPARTLAAGPGPGTAEALRAADVPASLVVEPAADSPSFDSESLWTALAARIDVERLQGARWLVVRGESGREWLAERLAERGALVDKVAAYRRRAPRFDGAALGMLETALAAPRDHVWVLSSSEAVRHLAERVAPGALAKARAIATHPRIAAAAQAAGFAEVDLVTPRPEDMAAAILSLRP